MMNNTSLTQGNHKFHMLFSPVITTLIKAIYTVITSIGIMNNFIAILVFWRVRQLRKPVNVLFMNIFAANMVFCLSSQPYIWVDLGKIGQQGNAAGLLCSMSVGMAPQMAGLTANVLSLFAVIILRYVSTVHNYQGYFVTSMTFVKVYCIFAWVAGLASTIPNVISLEYDHEELICYRKWPSAINGALYSTIMMITFLIIPLIAMIICYTLLAVHISKQSLALRDSNAQRVKKRISILLGLLILVFMLCWSPGFIVFILTRAFHYFPKGLKGEFVSQRWMKIAVLFGIVNPAIDPLIFTYSSSEFRAGLVRLYQYCRRSTVEVADN